MSILGRPNAGKSTLLNALVGERLAAVTAKEQTTRHRIPGFLTREDVQVVFLDTPGLLDPSDPLQKAMMESALGTLEGVDVVYWLVDHDEASSREQEVLDRLQAGGPPVLLVLTKTDQVPPAKMDVREGRWRESARWAGVHRISATTGEGLEDLLAATVERLPEQPFFYPADELTDLPIRFIAGELVREACYEELSAEVPYSVHVAVEEWGEPSTPGDKTVIRAVIYVERESQKGIVIGEGGSRLKAIGTRARRSIEALVGGPVYLTLWVKVQKKWSRREADLKRFGYRR
ncbi:MAG TPA: GTPase Era [Gemmatimonadota bacterium]|nr:GTPase Era [Gemmatimonadota bacterium]